MSDPQQPGGYPGEPQQPGAVPGQPYAQQPFSGAQQPPAGQQQPYPGQQPYAGQQQPYAAAPGAYQQSGDAPFSPETDKQIGLFSHLLLIISYFVGPLIIWLITRNRGPLANSEGKEALNFGIFTSIVEIAGWILVGIFSFILPPLGGLLALVVWLVPLARLIFAIIAGLHVNNTGTPYRYPVNIRLIS